MAKLPPVKLKTPVGRREFDASGVAYAFIAEGGACDIRVICTHISNGNGGSFISSDVNLGTSHLTRFFDYTPLGLLYAIKVSSDLANKLHLSEKSFTDALVGWSLLPESDLSIADTDCEMLSMSIIELIERTYSELIEEPPKMKDFELSESQLGLNGVFYIKDAVDKEVRCEASAVYINANRMAMISLIVFHHDSPTHVRHYSYTGKNIRKVMQDIDSVVNGSLPLDAHQGFLTYDLTKLILTCSHCGRSWADEPFLAAIRTCCTFCASTKGLSIRSMPHN